MNLFQVSTVRKCTGFGEASGGSERDTKGGGFGADQQDTKDAGK